MADRKISQLAAIGYTSIGEETQIPIVVNNSSSTTNKIYVEQFAIYISNQIGSGYVNVAGTQTITGEKTFTSPIISSVTTGTAPLQVASTTKVTNLNADLLDGLSSAAFQVALSGTGIVKSVSGTISYITDNSTNWTTAYNDKINSAAVTGTTTKTLTLTQQDGGTITASWSDINTDAVSSVFGRTGAIVATEGDYSLTQLSDVTLTSPSNGQVLKYNGTTWVNNSDTGLTSVGISMPSAFSVSNSPLTSNGTIAITGAGTTAQYVRGDGSLATFPTIANEAQRLITEVYNQSGSVMTKGTIVLLDAEHGNLPTITRALATGDATSAQTYGIVQNNISDMSNGYVVVIGLLENLDTRAYESGQILYLSSTIEGEWTTEKQYAPAHLVYVGIVVRVHPTQGSVAVKIQNGYEMDELHNVSAQSPNNGDILKYVSSTGLWTKTAGTTTNITEGTNLYFTNARARSAVSLTTTGTSGAASYNSSTGVLNIPQYQAALTNPITGTGTTNYLPKFTGASALGNSIVSDNGTRVTIDGDFRVALADANINLQGTSKSYLLQIVDSNNRFRIYDNTANAERFSIASNGSVGFGTSTPNKPVVISNSVSDKLWLTGGTAQNGIILDAVSTAHQYYIGAGNNLLVGGDSGIILGYDVTTSTSAIHFDGSGNVKFQAGVNTEKMRLTNGGSLLLGTSTEGIYKFDCNGTARINGDLSIPYGNTIRAINGTYTKLIETGYNGEDFVSFYTPGNSSGTAKLTLLANNKATFSGNIGWGGVTPIGDGANCSTLESSNGSQIAARNGFAQLYISSNVNGTPYAPTRSVAGFATQLSLDALGGTISFNRAVSGAAGSAISWINNLGFDNTGAATFSSTITATNGIFNNAAGGSIVLKYGGTDDWVVGENAGAATRDLNIYNFNRSTIELNINRATGTATFAGAIAINNSVAAGVAVASTHKVAIVIGGTTYYLLASNV
jgi:hypothetical protein